MDSSRSSSNLLTLCALFSLSPGRIYRGPAEYIMLNRTNKRLGGSDSVRHFLFKNRFPWVLLVGLLFLFIFTPFSWGKEKYFPLDKVKPGMSGFGYTVFGGTKIEKFDIKVLAVLDSSADQGKLIMVRLSGKRLAANGGLASGMSGSPVYIGSKLMGAISYGFENADPYLAMVTPIETMLKLLPDQGNSVSLSGINRLYLGQVVTAVRKHSGLVGSFKPVPLATPVILSGMGQRGYEMVQRSLQPLNLQTVYASNFGGVKLAEGKTNLRPGSAIGVQLIAGDYQAAAIGTVTLCDGPEFLAFGHPFTNRGTVDYLANEAFIYQTVKSQVLPFKLGAPIRAIGRIFQDRQAGIAGRLGELPSLIPVVVNVTDRDRKFSNQRRFQVVANEQLYRDLIISGVTDAIDQTIDRIGSGTAQVRLVIAGAERDPLLTRENLFYGKDIAVNCLKDLRQALDLISTNEFLAVPIRSIAVNVEVWNKQDSARIVSLALDTDPSKLKPGSSFKLIARLHTYRGEDLTVPFQVKIPPDTIPGKLILSLSGGSKDLPDETEDSEKVRTDEGLDGSGRIGSFQELLNNYSNAPLNNELVLDYVLPDSGTKSDASGKIGSIPPGLQLKVASDYFVLGDARLTLEILAP